jgi:hypothetical protein
MMALLRDEEFARRYLLGLFEADNLWYYIGHYRAVEWTDDPNHPLLQSCMGLSIRVPEAAARLELVYKNPPQALVIPSL